MTRRACFASASPPLATRHELHPTAWIRPLNLGRRRRWDNFNCGRNIRRRGRRRGRGARASRRDDDVAKGRNRTVGALRARTIAVPPLMLGTTAREQGRGGNRRRWGGIGRLRGRGGGGRRARDERRRGGRGRRGDGRGRDASHPASSNMALHYLSAIVRQEFADTR